MKIDDLVGSPRLRTSGLVLLFSIALLLRVTGLTSFYNGDENWGASVRVLTGDLSGGTSQTLPLVNYLNAVSFLPLYAIGRLVGVWHGTADFRAQYFRDPTPFIFAGRFVQACLGALTAFLAALIAGRLGLSRSSSLLVGAMVAILPMNVWRSHLAKTDSGVAFGVLLLAWSVLRKLDNPASKGADALVGLALAVAVSFKQTAILVAPPLLLGMTALLRWDCDRPWSGIARGLVVSLAACVLAWIPMNLGVLLDIKNFLEWQRFTLVTVQMTQSAYHTPELAVRTLAGNLQGLTPAGLLAWLFAPFVRRDRKVLMLWGSSAFAYVAINVASGRPIASQYYFPFNQLAFTLGCVAAVLLLERTGVSRAIGLVSTVAVLACAGGGSFEVVRQAMATPMSARCAEVIEAIAEPERDKILAALPYMLGVPISEAAASEDRERHERLGRKYGVTVLETPLERMRSRDRVARGYHVRRIPYSMGGDPNREGSLASRTNVIMPYWWPIQEEEWDLDYWTTRGFNIFMLIEGGGFSSSGVVLYDEPVYRSFHEAIEKRCELVATLPTSRYLFEERTVWIYRLRGRKELGPGR
jgi:hypothetical protein